MEIEYIGEGKKKRGGKEHYIKILIFLTFLLIFLFIIFTSFSNNVPFTGSIITGGAIINNFNNENTKKEIKFESELTIPELEVRGEFDRLEISGNSNSSLQVGNQKFDLGKISNNFLVFDNFDGVISFDEERIIEFKGKVSGVTINGVLVNPTKETTKINFENYFNYESLEIINGASVDEIKYITSGSIKLNDGKEILNIYDEKVIINDFYGNIMIEYGKFHAEGYISELSIIGKSNINIKA